MHIFNVFLTDTLLTDSSCKGLLSVFNKVIGFYICQQVLCEDVFAERLHTAVASGSWCGAERQRCGASGSPLM